MNRMHKVFLLGLVVFLAETSSAAGMERVAVLEFKDRAGLSENDRDYLVDVIVRGAVREALPVDRYVMMNKENMITLLEAQGLRLEEVCEGSCEVDVGKKIGAHYIVTGSIWKRGALLEVTVKLFETKSGNLRSQKSVSGADLDALSAPAREAVKGMVGSLVAAVSAPSGPVFLAPGAGPAGPSEAQVTEVEPTQKPTAATGPAGLYITTDPAGAEVYLGTVKAGTTEPAFQNTDFQAGTRVRVTLRKQDYHDKVFEVDLKPGIAKYEGVKLDPAFGTLVIESSPSGAKVTMGGREVGTTPYRNERMASGEHLVSLVLDLYRSVANEVVEVKDGEVTKKTYALEADFGTVSVDSEPKGARVLVSGKEMGKTPAELRLSPGDYEVVLDLEGHRGRSFKVAVARGASVSITSAQAKLERKEFSLTVLADPPVPGAKIWLDGKETGKTAPETLGGVSEGTHTLEVRTEKSSGKVDVSGRDGEAKTATVALKEVSGPVVAAPPGGQVAQGSGAAEGMVLIPGGTFWMGCVPGDSECKDGEKPRHQVTVDSFYMDTHEVTQAQYERVMGKNPSDFKNCSDCPVENVSWDDARSYCSKVGKRLPSEAEWEYAARGGKDGEVRHGSLGDVAWYDGNSEKKTHPVGKKAPNGFGLYDMLGNVYEWCSDWYDEGYYAKSPLKDPHGAESGAYRVLRGGSWFNVSRNVRASGRFGYTPGTGYYNLGFRCVRDQ